MPETFHDLPIPFPIFRYVSQAEHLHFGLWESDRDDFAVATERMAERVRDLLPPPPAYLLDVGCGIGGTSVHLARQGYRMFGLAPSDGLIAYARLLAEEQGVADLVRFESMGIEQLDTRAEGPFGGIFFQESFQYVRLIDEVVAGLETVLEPGGRLVITDQVRRKEELKVLSQFHSREEILAAAEGAGLRCTHHEDVTDLARPTVRKALDRIGKMRDELIEVFQDKIPDVADHIDVCLHNGGVEADFYQKGAIGYEFFVFER